MITKPEKQSKTKYTAHIKLCRRGVSDTGQRFCKLMIEGDRGAETLLVRETQLQDYRNELEAKGANLVSDAAWRELTARIQANGLKKPTLRVATRIEIRDDAMALPSGPYPKSKSFVVALTDVPTEIQRKYQVAGDLESWLALAEFGCGNSRLIFAFSLAFVGPLSATTAVEHVGFQFVGQGGEGKSGIGVVSSSVWGWDPDPTVADRNGFGCSWNTTINALERTLAGYNQTFIFLNETGVADAGGGNKPTKILETILKIEGSVGKDRLNDPIPQRSWFAPVLSTSNKSVVELVRAAEGKSDRLYASNSIDPAYLDRLADIPPPENGLGMFEDLHGYLDVAAFVADLKAKAALNHGRAGRLFVRKLIKARKREPEALARWIECRRVFYIGKATSQITTNDRNLTRLHGKFATVYAAGHLAAKYKILPFKRNAVFKAVLKCELDHVRFVEKQLNQEVTPSPSNVQRLRAYVAENQSRFIDLRGKNIVVPSTDVKAAPGFICNHKNQSEYLFASEKFDEILGGRAAADQCKRDLRTLGLIAKSGAGGSEIRFVVKRHVGEKRRLMVAVSDELLDAVMAPA